MRRAQNRRAFAAHNVLGDPLWASCLPRRQGPKAHQKNLPALFSKPIIQYATQENRIACSSTKTRPFAYCCVTDAPAMSQQASSCKSSVLPNLVN